MSDLRIFGVQKPISGVKTPKTSTSASAGIIYRNVKTIKDCQELQNYLFKLIDWEQKWGMLFHPDKCNSMQVTRSRIPLTFKYSLKGQDLEAVPRSGLVQQPFMEQPH